MASGSIRAGLAFIEIGEKGLAATQNKLKSFADSFDKVGQKVGAAGRQLFAWGAGATGAVVAATKIFADAGGNIDKLATSTGLSAKYLQEMGYAASASGGSLQSFSTLAGNVQERFQRLSQLADTDAVKIFGEMGMDIQALQRMNPEQRINAIVSSVSKLGKVEDQKKVLEELGAIDLLPMVRKGVTGIDQLRERANALGLVLSDSTIAAAKKVKQNFFEMGVVLGNVAIQIGAAAAPLMDKWLPAITLGATKVTEFIAANQELITLMAEGAVVVVGMGIALIGLGKGLELAGYATKALSLGFGIASTAVSIFGGVLTTIGAIIAAIASPGGLIVAGVVGIGVAVAYASGLFDGFGEAIGSAFQYIKTIFGNTWEKVATALKNGDMKTAAIAIWEAIKQVAGDSLNYLGERFGWFIGVATGAWESISTLAVDTWNVITAAATSFWDWLVGQYESNKEQFKKWVDYAIEITQNIWDFSVQAWGVIKDVAIQCWNAVSEAISSAWNSISPYVDSAIATVTNFVTNALDVFGLLTSDFKGTWDMFVAYTAVGLSRAWDRVTGFIVSIKDAFVTVFKAIGSAFQAVWEGIKSGKGVKEVLDGIFKNVMAEMEKGADKINKNMKDSGGTKLLQDDADKKLADLAKNREDKRKQKKDAGDFSGDTGLGGGASFDAIPLPDPTDVMGELFSEENMLEYFGVNNIDPLDELFSEENIADWLGIDTSGASAAKKKTDGGKNLMNSGLNSIGTFSGFALRGLTGNISPTVEEQKKTNAWLEKIEKQNLAKNFGGA